jgi:soluble lytic murein transglycosylase-like protein
MNLKVTNELKHFQSAPQADNNLSANDKARLQKAAKEFESLFTGMLLKSMTQNTEGMFGDNSFGGDYYNMIFQNAIANKISEGRGIGIADFIYKNLANQNINTEVIKTKIESVQQAEKAMKAEKGTEKIDLINHDDHLFSTPPSKSSLKRLNKFESYIDKASELFNVDKNLIKSVILAESAAKEKAVSGAKAKGLMQLMDQTARALGVNNVFDPEENIVGGTKYLSQMLRLYNGDVNLALASYNAGPQNVEKYNGVPPFEETRNYITRVLGYFNHFNG